MLYINWNIVQVRTRRTSVHEADDISYQHGAHNQVRDIRLPVRRHRAENAKNEADRTDVRKSAQGVRCYDNGAFLK